MTALLSRDAVLENASPFAVTVPTDRRAFGAFRALDTVAVALDGAAQALAPARALAARLDATLFVIGTDSRVDADAAVDAARADGLRAQSLHIAAPDWRQAATALLDVAAEVGAGMLVVAGPDAGTSGYPGHITQALVDQATLPLLLVPPYYGSRVGDGTTHWIGWDRVVAAAAQQGHPVAPLRLLVGLNGSPASELSLPLAAELMKKTGAQLSLIRVFPSSSTLYCSTTGTASAVDIGFGYLQRVVRGLENDGIPLPAMRTAIRLGNTAEELLGQAAREEAAILVLARRRLAPTASHLHTGVTASLLNRSPLPLLVVPV